MSDNRTKNVIKNSTASLIQRFVQILAHFALRTVFIYFLGKEYTGISGLFTDVLQVISLMELGLDASMIYSLYEPLAKHDKRRIAALLNFYRKAFNIIGVAVLLIGIGCTPFLDYIVKDVPNIHEDIRVIFMFYVATSACSYFLIYRSVLLRADQKSRVISNISSFVIIAETIAEAVILVLFRSFFGYLIIHFIATVGRNFIVSLVSTKTYREYFNDTESRLSKSEIHKLFVDMFCLTMYDLSGVVINSTDSIFISAFVGTVEVAIIGNFTLILNAARTAINQIVSATKPSIGNLAATSSDDKQELVFKRMNFISFWVSCVGCTCLFILLNPFIGGIWFDESYRIAPILVAVLVANFFIAVMVTPVESFRTANGLFVQGWLRPLIMAVFNIVLDFIWGRAWGIFGIFIATTVSRLTTQVWYDPWLVYKWVFKKSCSAYFVTYISYAGITAISCFSANILCNLINVSNKWTDFGMRFIIAMIIPNLIVWLVYHKSDEFAYLLSFGEKIRRKLKR